MKQVRILVVDDAPTSCKLLARILETEGYEVDQALNGKQALQFLESSEYEIALLDIRLPDVSGLDLLSTIKETGRKTEVVIHTAYASLETSIEALNQGAYGYIIKPFRPQEVRLIVKRALQKQELERENQRLLEHLKKRNMELKSAYQELEDLTYRLITSEKKAAVTTLGAGIAHELNNPLTVILGLLGLVLEKEETGTERYDRLAKIRNEIKRCAQVVRDLLTFTREVAGKLEEVDCNQVLRRVLALIAYRLQKSGIDTRINLGRDLPSLKANPGQLGQVFLNMFLNALAAVEEKDDAIIEVETKAVADSVVITFKDNGCGISRENITRVFEPFFSTKETGQGAGLGLAVSEGIVGSLGGKISVESKEGQGSVFQVVLPVLAQA